MVVVSGARLLARQTASRKLSVVGIEVVLDVQALIVSMSAVVFTFSVTEALEVISVGTDWDEVRTTTSRDALIFCGKARAATGVPENEIPALGLAAAPDVSRMLSWPRTASSTIKSCVEELARRGEMAEISVSDTGRGIPLENQQKIFQLFFTTRPGGSGIGLATTFRIVQLHNGSIDFQSEAGRGTTFRIELPLAA